MFTEDWKCECAIVSGEWDGSQIAALATRSGSWRLVWDINECTRTVCHVGEATCSDIYHFDILSLWYIYHFDISSLWYIYIIYDIPVYYGGSKKFKNQFLKGASPTTNVIKWLCDISGHFIWFRGGTSRSTFWLEFPWGKYISLRRDPLCTVNSKRCLTTTVFLTQILIGSTNHPNLATNRHLLNRILVDPIGWLFSDLDDWLTDSDDWLTQSEIQWEIQ